MESVDSSFLVSSIPAGNPLRREVNELLSILRHTENIIDLQKEQAQDLRQTNADLFNLHACEYIEAVADRRKVWLDNSRIKLNIQRELAQLPIDIFSDTKRDSGDLLGTKATTRLGQELEARKAAHEFKMSEVSLNAVKNYTPGPKASPGGNKNNLPAKKKKNQNTNSVSLGTGSSIPDSSVFVLAEL